MRLRADGTWGDTMSFGADGALQGSANYAVPPNLHWEVKRDSQATPQFCAAVSGDAFCRPYRLTDSQLELLGGPRGNTIFRRVP